MLNVTLRNYIYYMLEFIPLIVRIAICSFVIIKTFNVKY